jgi:DeoR/GlpR family transcriptional regulator of sugar metabolism
VVLLVDSEKFGQQALSDLCPLSEIDVVVSDADLVDEHRQHVRGAGCELIIADRGEANGGESEESEK